MTDNPLEQSLAKLTDIQREAVAWDDGAMLVLAGPGSGKTQVLTCRIARLLDEGRDKSFRILALTFTNKAADEMKERVTNFVPGLEERANIGTFHSFCGQDLRQHGIHLGIKPDFAIYSQDGDRKAVLEDALKRAGMDPLAIRYLSLIDRMKTMLVDPKDAESRLTRTTDAHAIALTYQAYEDELRRVNVLDFNSLIFEAHRLFSNFPAIAVRYRRTYPYWLLDEFQDTNDGQYRLIRSMAGQDFKNVFAVADDDQIIYQWNGASFRQLQRFRADFSPQLIQLPTNYRCPPAIVAAANRLVAYNVQRTEAKKPLVAGKTELKLPEHEHIQLRAFDSDETEAEEIAKEIAARGKGQWGQTTVLARTRALLERMQKALQVQQVPAVIAQRRDDFLSAEIRWLVACLVETVRPLDRRNLAVLVDAFNRFAESREAEECYGRSSARQPLRWPPHHASVARLLTSFARTTPGVRAELQASKATTSTLARLYGLSRTTVTKWLRRSRTSDAPLGPRERRSTVPTAAEEAVIVTFRQRTMLLLEDVMGWDEMGWDACARAFRS